MIVSECLVFNIANAVHNWKLQCSYCIYILTDPPVIATPDQPPIVTDDGIE